MTTETVVGVENSTGDGAAHLVVTPSPGALGMSYCGFPSERLMLMPDLDWAMLPAERQCPHCGEAAKDA